MSQQDSDTGPVTFLDVAACFSDEQWKLLHEWQKELYKNVMKDIHQALISLGPLIATSVFSLRPKEKQDLYPVDHQDSERRHSNIHSPRFPFINSDICLREEGESSAGLIDQLGADEGECSPDPSSGHAVISSVVSFHIKEVEEACSADHQDWVSAENTSSSAGGPYLSTDFCLRKKEESSVSLMVHRGAEGGESSTDHSSGHAEVPEVVLVRIKEEEEPYSMDHQHSERIESISSQTAVDGSMNKQRKVGYSIKSTKRKAPCQATPGNANAKVLQRSQKGTKSRIQVWSECDSQLEEEKTIQCESGFINPSQVHFHQDRPKVRRSVKVNEFESNLNNSEFLTCRPHPQQNQRPYTCTECDKSYSLKGEFIRHIGTHTGVRPYECTECEKSFFQRPHLIRHRRTHSGEKPYECPFCHKRFNRKDNLSGHQKIHTGEKPFQCTECEKRFLRKGDLNEHRRKHAYSETLTLRKSKSYDKIERPQ